MREEPTVVHHVVVIISYLMILLCMIILFAVMIILLVILVLRVEWSSIHKTLHIVLVIKSSHPTRRSVVIEWARMKPVTVMSERQQSM